jgi:formylglycine-generating enzyme required for sulfatase activity
LDTTAMKLITVCLIVLLALGNVTRKSLADTFGSGPNQFTMEFVPIGDPGNPADTTGRPNPVGTVPYFYNMGKYEVSRDQYIKANTEVGLGIPVGTLNIEGGSNPQLPVTYVTWNWAARFTNWLNTSQGFPPAYKFEYQPGAVGYDANQNISLWADGDAGYNPANPFRNSLAKYFLPSVDEWYKAAFYDRSTSTYFDHAAGSNTVPMAVASGTAAGTAVYGQSATTGPAQITQAGGLSPYGVMGMSGNAVEWEETAYDLVNASASEFRGLRGGSWLRSSPGSASERDRGDPSSDGFHIGFRVASKSAGAEFGDLEFGDLLYKFTFAEVMNLNDDAFGYSVAVQGTTAIVGSGTPFPNEQNIPKEIHVYDLLTGQRRYTLENSDVTAKEGFGYSVAISGNTFIAGAGNGASDGSALVFDVATGRLLQELTPTGALPGDWVGRSLAMDGNRAILGALGDDHAGTISGAAYLFDVTTGQELFKLTASDAAERDQFGLSVDISGNIAIVGAPSQFTAPNKPGAAYLFDVTTGRQLRKLIAPDATPTDNFGQSVALNDNIAIIGAPGKSTAYVFDVTTGQELLKLTPSEGGGFGGPIAISGNTAIIGPYLFDVLTGQELLKLSAYDGAPNQDFAWSVAIDANTAIIGTIRAAGVDAGAAYVFDVTQNPRTPGDFNDDGTVDAADYIVWRNGLGTTHTQTHYDAWRANFGATAATTRGSTGDLNPAVPEPLSAVLLAFSLLPLIAMHRWT